MLPFTQVFVVIAIISAAHGQFSGQRARSSRASNLPEQPEEQARDRRSSSYYQDDEYGYGMPRSIVLKDDPHIDHLFPYPRFPRVHLALEPEHYDYNRYKRNDVEASVRSARSFSGFGDSDFKRRSAEAPTIQKRTVEQTARTGRSGAQAVNNVQQAVRSGRSVAQSATNFQQTARNGRSDAQLPTTRLVKPTKNARSLNLARTQVVGSRQVAPVQQSSRQKRNSVQKRSDSEAVYVPVYEPHQQNKRSDYFASPDADYDVTPGYESYKTPSYRSSNKYQRQYQPAYKSYDEPAYQEPAYKKPAYNEYKKPSYSEPAYQKPAYEEPAYTPSYKPTYSEPAYKPAYSEPAYKPAYSEPAYKPAYAEPAYKPAYTEPAYKPAYSEPAYKPAYSEPAYKPAYKPTYPEPSYTKPTYEPTYSEPAYKEPAYQAYTKPSYDEYKPKPSYDSYKPKLPTYEPAHGDEVAYGAETGSYGAFNWYTDHPVKTAQPTYY